MLAMQKINFTSTYIIICILKMFQKINLRKQWQPVCIRYWARCLVGKNKCIQIVKATEWKLYTEFYEKSNVTNKYKTQT